MIELELREFLFQPLRDKKFSFVITAQEKGIFSGAKRFKEILTELNIKVDWVAEEGFSLQPDTPVFRGSGTAEKVARAEEMLLGVIGKPSGVATAAAEFIKRSGGKIKVVCGAWKKVAPEIRADLRQAIATGGAGMRITEAPFIYLDKNYVRMFNGVGPAVRRAVEFDPERLVAVQLKGETQPIIEEVREAVGSGASILMIDTGNTADLRTAVNVAIENGWRDKVQFAFGGGVTQKDFPEVIAAGADIVDVGRAIIDAPLLDFRLDVEKKEE
ncbi:nicotinate-nucleotide pyrophosphorylase [Desulfotomaculum nigrificans]|uniref:nicotinate-nucleotide pyrophosphorylase n=1 Tax=Desulfotomaculum nigrificans TaxID=1565 RepID=UPI001FA6D0C1|nr:nicotinate-nucleotide pyrophosphorylase [Desulfotomaculum nigrificans]